MRLSELARASGVSIPSIKFYLRGGLLPAGEALSKTQADYNQAHIDRLRLIRALREVGQLPIATIASILAALDDPSVSVVELMGIAQAAVARPLAVVSPAGRIAARTLLDDLGWTVAEGSPIVDSLGSVLQVLMEQGRPVDANSLYPWAKAAEDVAAAEVASIPADAPRAVAADAIAVGTVLYGELLTQLRLAAQESASLERFGAGRARGEHEVAHR